MKKLLFLIAITIFFFIACTNEAIENQPIMKMHTRYISKDEARKQVLDILNQSGFRTRSNGYFDGMNITSSFTRKYSYYIGNEEESCDMYIFNFGNNDGYAAMLSDSKTDQLLVLTSEGKIEEDDPNIDIMFPPIVFDDTSEPDTIEHFDSILVEPYVIDGPWFNVTIGYAPYSYVDFVEGNITRNFGLTKVRWHQDFPFNIYCPVTQLGNSPTGCVATATAMLMSYYEHPTSYKGYTFNWSGMKTDPYASHQDTTYTYQIARLMRILGNSDNLHMNYGIDESGSNIKYVPETLENLGYTSGGKVIYYDINQIEFEITNNGPVIIQGKGDDGSGHAWVVDAILKRIRELKYYSYTGKYLYSEYQTSYYLNCNWGIKLYMNNIGFYSSKYFDNTKTPEYDRNLNYNGYVPPYYKNELMMLYKVEK